MYVGPLLPIEVGQEILIRTNMAVWVSNDCRVGYGIHHGGELDRTGLQDKRAPANAVVVQRPIDVLRVSIKLA